jgi:ABC-type lipoprotein release transport system permease subunit
MMQGRLIWNLARRSVARKRLRSLATIGAMGLAGAMVIFFTGIMLGFMQRMVDNVVDNETAHLQAHAAGYRLDPDLYKTLPAPSDPALTAAPRLLGFGLAAHGDASTGAELRGLDVAAESKVSRLHLAVEHGHWLDPAEPEGVVLGKKLAKRLNASVGDELILLTQAADGSMADALVRVRGVLKTVGAKTDEASLFSTEAFFRELYALPEGWHEVAVRLPGEKPDLEAGKAALQAALPGAELRDWRTLMPMAATMVDSQGASMAIFMVIAYLAVAMVVFNAMLMSVFERVREFGLMKALGVGPGLVFASIVMEALIEALAAGLVALAIGLPLCFAMEAWGLDLRFLMPESANMGGLAFDPVLTSRLTLSAVLTPLAALVGMALLAVLYPALKAARLDPVAAMRHR